MTINPPVFPRRPIQHIATDYVAKKCADGWALHCNGEPTGIVCPTPDACMNKAARLLGAIDASIAEWDAVYGGRVLGLVEGRDYLWELEDE